MDPRVFLCVIFCITALAFAQKVTEKPLNNENETQVKDAKTKEIPQGKSPAEMNKLDDDNEENEDESAENDDDEEESREESEENLDNPTTVEKIKSTKKESKTKGTMKQNLNTSKDKNVTEGTTKRAEDEKTMQLKNVSRKEEKSEESKAPDITKTGQNKSDSVTQSKKEQINDPTEKSQIDQPLKEEPQTKEKKSETNIFKQNQKDTSESNDGRKSEYKTNFQNTPAKKPDQTKNFEQQPSETQTSLPKPISVTQVPQNKQEKKNTQQNVNNNTNGEPILKSESPDSSDIKEKGKNKSDNATESNKEQVKDGTKISQNIKPLKQEPKTKENKVETNKLQENQNDKSESNDGKKPENKTNGQNTTTPQTDQKQKEQNSEKNRTSLPKPINVTQLPQDKQEKKKTQQNPKINEEPKLKRKSLERPHIVFIMVDDLGWNDVSFHGADEIMTPNIDTLAYTGVVLPQYYTDVQGTASRSALFTGKLPVRLGTHGDSIKASEDRGIPVSELLLPSYLRDQGYATHLIGKWDVGKSREQYLPTSRGFETFYGFLGSAVDYYTYNLIEETNQTSFFGLDFFDGITPVENQQGHLTEVLTNRAVQIIRDHKPEIPLYLHLSHAAPHAGGALVNIQTPEADIQANDHIAHSARRLYAGLVTSLDKSIGHVIGALAEREMLDNTLIVFTSDNGAPTIGETQNYGSNLPLRGLKNTPWEGGARSIALMWHKSLKPGSYNGLFHVTDWLPTLLKAAGRNTTIKVDGINQWDAIVEPDGPPKRTDVLVSINEEWAALREGHFKLVVGNLDKDRSGYQGLQLKALRYKPLPYETILLKSETYMVFRETLKMVLDVDEAMRKRKASSLLSHVHKEDSEPCIPTKDKGCLYNITADPIEARDLWNIHPDIVRRLTLRLRTFWTELKPRATKRDVRADPSQHKYIWVPWVKNDEVKIQPNLTSPPFPLQVSMGELQYLVDLNLNLFKDKIYESVKSMGDSFLKSFGGLFNF